MPFIFKCSPYNRLTTIGDPSSLRFVPASSSATQIDWTRVPEATKKILIEQYARYDWEKKDFKPLPETIGDLAKMFDDTKFFGYLGSDILKVLMDISEFGLQPIPSNGLERPVGPRFYMSYVQQVWFLLFAPGTRECIEGYCDIKSSINDDDDYDEAWEKVAAEETVMAQAFDVKLEREVSRGRGEMVEFTEKLGGWTAWTLPSQLEDSQYMEAIKTLPKSHPAYLGLMGAVFRSIGK